MASLMNDASRQRHTAFWLLAGFDAALIIVGTVLLLSGFGLGVVVAVLGLLLLNLIWGVLPRPAGPATESSPPRRISHRTSMTCSVVAILLSWLLVPAFMCACGDFNLESLPFVGAVAALAWFGYLTSSRNDIPVMAIRAVSVIASTMWVLKATVDVLWGGHHPIL